MADLDAIANDIFGPSSGSKKSSTETIVSDGASKKGLGRIAVPTSGAMFSPEKSSRTESQIQEYYSEPPTPKELGQEYFEALKGASAAIPGQFGDIEQLGRYGINKLGADVDEDTILPTTEKISSKLGTPSSEKLRKARETGKIVGGFIGPEALAQGLKLGTKAFLGTTTATREAAAKVLEDIGVKIEPMQLTGETPRESAGFGANREKNQKEIDKAVSKETGVETDQINPKFIGQRLDDLNKNYDKIFKRTIQADSSLVDDLIQIRDFEKSIRPAGVTPAASAADSIINRYNELQSIVGERGKLTAFPVDGEVIRRLRQEMSDIARTAQDGNTRRIAGQFVEKIDNNFLRNHRDLKKLLEETNRKYAATKTLQEGIEKGFIKGGNISLKGLGDYLANNTYGFGSGTTKHPLFDLGNAGREANQTAIWETPDKGKPLLTALGGKTAKILGALGGPIGPRSQLARSAQRRLSEGKFPFKIPSEATPIAGLASSLNRENQSELTDEDFLTIRKGK